MVQKVRLHKVLVINTTNIITNILLYERVKIWKEKLIKKFFCQESYISVQGHHLKVINLCTYARQKWQLQQDFRESLDSWSIQYRTPLFGDYLVAMATVTIQLVS